MTQLEMNLCFSFRAVGVYLADVLFGTYFVASVYIDLIEL
jgi:hypothetical protein